MQRNETTGSPSAIQADGFSSGDEGIGERLTVAPARQLRLVSKNTGRTYRIMVAEPRSATAPEGYPILYLLDGNATFLTAVEAVRVQSWLPDGVPPAAVVGIGYETDEPYSVTDRTIDYTTPADPANLTRRGPNGELPEVGGADRFLDFVEGERKPLIASLLPVDPARQTLIGHSFGGLLTLHAFTQRTGAFTSFVAGSPSLWWNGRDLLGRLASFAAEKPDLAGKRLMIGIGGQERNDIVECGRLAAAALAPLAARGLAFRHHEFAGEGHLSVIPALISRAVAFSLSPPDLIDKPQER